MRTLATIQTIKSLDPIAGKDRIVLASFENVGWKVIVNKEQTKVGDKVVYVEYDSILPQKPEFDFLRKNCWSPKWNGFRIRSMKMGEVYSEGIAFPLSILPPMKQGEYKDGQDVTDLVGVTKYDPEALEEQSLIKQDKQKHGKIITFLLRFTFFRKLFYPVKGKRKDWPEWAHKSDETRVQILPYVYDKYQGEPMYITEKLDGQSALFGICKKEYVVCSRNLRLPPPPKLAGQNYAAQKSNYWKVSDKYKIESKLRKAVKELGYDIYIQGEQCGPGIQGNKYNYSELELFVFNIYNITAKKYFSWEAVESFCNTYGFQTVPILGYRKFDWKNVDEIIEYAKGMSVEKLDVQREGVVIRSVSHQPPDQWQSNMRSFKVINPDFMLKYGAEDEARQVKEKEMK